MRILFIYSIAILFSISNLVAQDSPDGGKSTTPTASQGLIHVKDSIYMIKGKGGNIGVSVGEDGVLMVDNQFAEATPQIVNYVAGLSSKPIKFLVNTHHHGDHTGGNKNMNDLGTTIVAHDNVRNRLRAQVMKEASEKQEKAFEEIRKKYAADGSEKADTRAKEAIQDPEQFINPDNIYPTITFSKNLAFYYNGEKVSVLHLSKGHTDGDAVVYFTQSNVLHTGDLFFNGKYPYIDLESGGTIDGYIKAQEKMMMLVDDETRIIPGHGPIGTKASLKENHDMLVFLRDRILVNYGMGKTLEEIINDEEISKAFDDKGYGDGFISSERFKTFLYEYAKKRLGPLEKKK